MTLHNIATRFKNASILIGGAYWIAILVLPLLLAYFVLGLREWDLSVPLLYGNTDHIWQMALNKALHETGWILTNPFLGAPDVANWHQNASAQTSALHSVLMLGLSPFFDDAIRLQQIYYLLNFPLICFTTFYACRLLNIARLPSFCVGMLFTFTKFRIDEMLYSYLANYFMVPLAAVAVIWVIRGDLNPVQGGPSESTKGDRLRAFFARPNFKLGLLFVCLVAASDGYYSFFTLLLLGFAMGVRLIFGDWKKPKLLLPGAIYIAAIFVCAGLLQIPLIAYQNTHKYEFYPNGVADPALIKHPFEAEAYSSSLKLLLSPNQNHHVRRLGELGKTMVASSDDARKYPTDNYWPLGVLGSAIFICSLIFLMFPFIGKSTADQTVSFASGEKRRSDFAIVLPPLILFSFFVLTAGGVGSLVALIFPTIRAYYRFPVFLIFLLYLCGAWYATLKLKTTDGFRRLMWTTAIVLITCASLYDQIPSNSKKGNPPDAQRFLADRSFVKSVENALPAGAMVYQYPYSQYLMDSPYYGWGSFAHIRLYLHSHGLRWSNGGAKNSFSDDWNRRISNLPLEQLLTEIEAVGFKGLVIDRTVVNDAQYDKLRTTLEDSKYVLVDDASSKLVFAKLHKPGVALEYDTDYKGVRQFTVLDPDAIANGRVPRLLDASAVKQLLSTQAVKAGTVITRAAHPSLFISAQTLARGSGETAMQASEMLGAMKCEVRASPSKANGREVVLTISNLSAFDWKLNSGQYPIGVGVHSRHSNGEIDVWDMGFRASTSASIKHGDSAEVIVPLRAISERMRSKQVGDTIEFALLQDANAWFQNIACSIPN